MSASSMLNAAVLTNRPPRFAATRACVESVEAATLAVPTSTTFGKTTLRQRGDDVRDWCGPHLVPGATVGDLPRDHRRNPAHTLEKCGTPPTGGRPSLLEQPLYSAAVVAPKARTSRSTSASFDRNIYYLAPTKLTICAVGLQLEGRVANLLIIAAVAPYCCRHAVRRCSFVSRNRPRTPRRSGLADKWLEPGRGCVNSRLTFVGSVRALRQTVEHAVGGMQLSIRECAWEVAVVVRNDRDDHDVNS